MTGWIIEGWKQKKTDQAQKAKEKLDEPASESLKLSYTSQGMRPRSSSVPVKRTRRARPQRRNMPSSWGPAKRASSNQLPCASSEPGLVQVLRKVWMRRFMADVEMLRARLEKMKGVVRPLVLS